MESLSRILRAKSSTSIKGSTPFSKDLQRLPKQSSTPNAKRELLKNIYFPTSPSKAIYQSFEKQMSLSSFLKLQSTPKRRTKSNSLQKSAGSEKFIQASRLRTDSSKPKSPKKSQRLLKPSPRSTQFATRKKFLLPSKKLKSLRRKYIKVVSNISFRTKTGSFKGKQKANNQDNFLVIQDYCQIKGQSLIGVMDGHGMYGHDVSKFIKHELPLLLESYLPQEDMPQDSSTQEFFEKPFKLAFQQTQKALISNHKIDINYSGSTGILLLLKDRTCICANLGDSRAIIGSFNKLWYPIELSKDHKPGNTNEKRRIEHSGGRVEPCKEANGELIGPDRVWLKHEQLPGLAMSRSFGDRVAAHVGVICEPDVITHDITEDDKFIVIASDGVWEFISNNECVDIVAEYYEAKDIEKASDALMKKANDKWRQEDEIVDDITFVIVFLE